ncbi:MAG: M23 family metallopeptidase [Bacteroidetes bacterium]|nr:MAG: M23 family metallopeptidase [Bacteroidota bacterium]
MKRWIVCLLTIVAGVAAKAQNYPTGYFRSPIDTTLYLSANFGAVRGNHFHSGIDIKTFGKEGLPVVAAADGYIVRIKVSPFGYGRALYMNHPNGYTTVYAHLQRFSPLLDSIVRAEQYRQKSFDVEMFPQRALYSFKKGDTIGFSGNSGGSTGPHLHFEIRDTKSEEIIDPLLFGLPIQDSYSPRLAKSYLVYEIDEDFKHKNGHYPYVEVKQKTDDTVKVRPGNYAFAAWGEDFINEPNDGVHINYLDVLANGEKIFGCGIDRFAFDDTRMVNAHIEYSDYKNNSNRWHKCFVDDGNQMPFYDPLPKAAVKLSQGETKAIAIRAYDLASFADTIKILLQGDTNQQAFMAFFPQTKSTTYAYSSKNYTYTGSGYSFTLPKGALYDTIVVTSKITPAKRKGLYAGYISVMDANVPLHKSFSISITPKNTKALDVEKLVVVRLTGKGLKYMSSEGGSYQNGTVTANSKTFGIFSVAYDDIPPVVDRFKVRDSLVSVRITDALSGIESYNAYIDGNWWLMEYDAKDDMLYGILPKEMTAGKHDFKLIVTDKKKNTTALLQTIER